MCAGPNLSLFTVEEISYLCQQHKCISTNDKFTSYRANKLDQPLVWKAQNPAVSFGLCRLADSFAGPELMLHEKERHEGLAHCSDDWCLVWLIVVLIQSSRLCGNPLSFSIVWILFLQNRASLSLKPSQHLRRCPNSWVLMWDTFYNCMYYIETVGSSTNRFCLVKKWGNEDSLWTEQDKGIDFSKL